MAQHAAKLYDPEDMDALHILPLAIIPLKTRALRRARLIKNTQLEGMVELFSGQETGSGQVEPDELRMVLAFTRDNKADIAIVQSLCDLPSYDVYSLRMELRRHGIPVDEHHALRLSDRKMHELAAHMRMFTRPLVVAVYGNRKKKVANVHDILNLFTAPDVDVARQNLYRIARKLGIQLKDIPRFLENYGDVYLSLAYYQSCFEMNLPKIYRVLRTLDEIEHDRELGTSDSLRTACRTVDQKLRGVTTEIGGILNMFRVRTEDMWQDISAERFRAMERVILDYQTAIGGGLCALTVKMNAWHRTFPPRRQGGLRRRAEFVMSELRPGIERIRDIRYSDAA